MEKIEINSYYKKRWKSLYIRKLKKFLGIIKLLIIVILLYSTLSKDLQLIDQKSAI